MGHYIEVKFPIGILMQQCWWLKRNACEESSKEKFPFHLTTQPETSISAFYSSSLKYIILNLYLHQEMGEVCNAIFYGYTSLNDSLLVIFLQMIVLKRRFQYVISNSKYKDNFRCQTNFI